MLNSRASVLAVCAAVMAMGVAAAEKEKTKEDEKAPTAEHVAKLVKNLGDESFEVREAASKALKKLGASAKPMLREALKKKDLDPEASARIKAIIEPEAKLSGKTVTDPKTGLTVSIEENGGAVVASSQRGRIWMTKMPGWVAEKLSIKDGKVIVESTPDDRQARTVAQYDLATGKMLSGERRK